MTFENVSFADFDCNSDTYAIHAGDTQSRNGEDLYEASTKLAGGVTFERTTTRIAACQVGEQGVGFLAFEDVDGSLNPTNEGVPGFIVSDESTMISLVGKTCTFMSDKACLVYCEDACLQTFIVGISFDWDVFDMVLTDGKGQQFTIPYHAPRKPDGRFE